VTDADVVLGLIRPEAFLGGKMPLDRDAAYAVMKELGDQVGLSPEETAAGVLRINNNNASTLIRQQTLERGYDTRDFRIYAFGGAGPVHAFGYAPELGCTEVVVPLANGASTLSAYGIASSDIVQYFELERQLRAPFKATDLSAALADTERQARESLRDLGFKDDEVQIERTALMRYAEQFMQSLPVRIPEGPIESGTGQKVRELFDEEYARQYGEGAKVIFQAVEIFALRIRATVGLGFSRFVSDEEPSATLDPAAHVEERQVYWPTSMSYQATDVFDGVQLTNGNVVHGPAIVELPLTTVAIAPGQSLRKDALGSLVLSV
jgi:N-methylhydantoinase A